MGKIGLLSAAGTPSSSLKDGDLGGNRGNEGNPIIVGQGKEKVISLTLVSASSIKPSQKKDCKGSTRIGVGNDTMTSPHDFFSMTYWEKGTGVS